MHITEHVTACATENWHKKVGELLWFAKFPKVFPLQSFLLYSINYPSTAHCEVVTPLIAPLQRFKEQDVKLAGYPTIHWINAYIKVLL